MNNNTPLKTILAGLFLAAIYAFTQYSGGSAPTRQAPYPPDAQSNRPSNGESPNWQPSPQSRNPDSEPNPEHESHRSRHHSNQNEREQPQQRDPRDREQREPRDRDPRENQPENQPREQPRENPAGGRRDLSQDEQHRGHTLQKHVGRTDQQLLERLAEERDINSASTYTDRDAAEITVGAALEKNRSKIEAWIHQGPNRSNLAFDYSGDGHTQIGRSIHRNATQSVPCYGAKVVLKAAGESFYVLTSYPEAR